jgi:hypothetical protein
MDPISYPLFKFNQDFPTASSIVKFAGSTHGLTLAALSIIDTPNKNLHIDITCSGSTQLLDYSEQLKCILSTYDITKVHFRSVKIDGKYQATYTNLTLETNV